MKNAKMTQEQFIEKGLNVLEELLKDNEQRKLREQISKLVETMGYTACAREILNNRKPKDNAKYALNLYYKDKTGDRINPTTREVYKMPQETIEKMNEFKQIFMLMVDKLESNNKKQLEYLELKIKYENALFQLAQLYKDHDILFDSLTERNEESIKKVEEHSKLIDEQRKFKQEIEDQLDRLVLDNLK